MIQRTAFKALLEHKGQLLLLGLTCLVESLSIVGQAWFFGTLINNFIFTYPFRVSTAMFYIAKFLIL